MDPKHVSESERNRTASVPSQVGFLSDQLMYFCKTLSHCLNQPMKNKICNKLLLKHHVPTVDPILSNN